MDTLKHIKDVLQFNFKVHLAEALSSFTVSKVCGVTKRILMYHFQLKVLLSMTLKKS